MIDPRNVAPHEIVIVGGGPAGVSTALFLAHCRPDLAERIVILEKDSYPRDKYCAGGIGARADKALAAIGVRVAVPSVPVHGVSASFQGGDVALRDGEIGRVVRRIEFDQALAEVARARGLRIIEGARVSDVVWRGGEATVVSSAGELRARVVVGADGVGSVVRRAMGLPFGRLRAQVVEVDTEPAARDRSRDLLHFDLSDRSYPGYLWDFPTLVDGRPLVCRGAYVLHGTSQPAVDAGDVLRAHLARLGMDLGAYRVKRFSERGFEPGRPLSRPGAILVGEAAGIDPMLGEGIAQAIDYGALAGRYLAEKLALNRLCFEDWSLRVALSILGADLRFRTELVPRFFGSALRDKIEREVASDPVFLRAGMKYFGGKRIPAVDLLHVAASGAASLARLSLARLSLARLDLKTED